MRKMAFCEVLSPDKKPPTFGAETWAPLTRSWFDIAPTLAMQAAHTCVWNDAQVADLLGTVAKFVENLFRSKYSSPNFSPDPYKKVFANKNDDEMQVVQEMLLLLAFRQY